MGRGERIHDSNALDFVWNIMTCVSYELDEIQMYELCHRRMKRGWQTLEIYSFNNF